MSEALEKSILDAMFGERPEGYEHPEYRKLYASTMAGGMVGEFKEVSLSDVKAEAVAPGYDSSPYHVEDGASIITPVCDVGAVDVILPTASSNTGRMIIMKAGGGCSGSSPITLTVCGSGQIDGADQFIIDNSFAGLTLISNGIEWLIL